MYAKMCGKMGCAVLTVAILTVIGGQQAVGYIITDELAVTGFDRVYDFDTGLLPDATDLDGNDTMDWSHGGDVSFTVGGGLLSYDTPSAAANNAWYISSGANEIWPQAGISYVDGFTVEIRARVNSVAADAVDGALGVFARGDSPNNCNVVFSVRGDSLVFGSNPGTQTFARTLNNVGDFHTFRVVQEPATETYSFYRDGVLLLEGEPSPYVRSLSQRMWFGDAGSYMAGNVDIDYVGFHSGAYAPVGFTNGMPNARNLLTKDSSTFTYKYEMDLDPANALDIDLDGNSQSDFEVPPGSLTPALTGSGTVLFESGTDAADTCMYDGGIGNPTTALWSTQNFTLLDEGYTIEFRAKITSAIGPELGVLQVTSCPSDDDEMAILNVGMQGVGLGSGLGLDDSDNSDDFHVFRIVANPADEGERYFIFRDDELLTPLEGIRAKRYLERNALYFGDNGGSNGGTIEMDYIRFMKGAFAPEDWVSEVPGDTDEDGDVDANDLAVVAAHWGETVDPNDYTVGNFNDDTVVDAIDAAIQAANWTGAGEGGGATVPEPGLIALALGLLAGLLPRWRK